MRNSQHIFLSLTTESGLNSLFFDKKDRMDAQKILKIK